MDERRLEKLLQRLFASILVLEPATEMMSAAVTAECDGDEIMRLAVDVHTERDIDLLLDPLREAGIVPRTLMSDSMYIYSWMGRCKHLMDTRAVRYNGWAMRETQRSWCGRYFSTIEGMFDRLASWWPPEDVERERKKREARPICRNCVTLREQHIEEHGSRAVMMLERG